MLRSLGIGYYQHSNLDNAISMFQLADDNSVWIIKLLDKVKEDRDIQKEQEAALIRQNQTKDFSQNRYLDRKYNVVHEMLEDKFFDFSGDKGFLGLDLKKYENP